MWGRWDVPFSASDAPPESFLFQLPNPLLQELLPRFLLSIFLTLRQAVAGAGLLE
jgi:hypothetical protein